MPRHLLLGRAAGMAQLAEVHARTHEEPRVEPARRVPDQVDRTLLARGREQRVVALVPAMLAAGA